MAIKKDFAVEAGATFFYPWVWRQPQLDASQNVVYTTDPLTGAQVPAAGAPVDLTGFTAKMQARLSITASDVLITLTEKIIPDESAIDFTVSGIYIVELGGYVAIVMSAADTETLGASGIYDLELTSSGGFVYRIFKGKVRWDRDVTR